MREKVTEVCSMNGPVAGFSSIHFIPFPWCEALICLARGASGFTGGVNNWCIAPFYWGTFSLFALSWDTFPQYRYTVVQTTQIQKLIHGCVLKHVFSVRSADTHSLNQPPTQYHSAPVYITKTHFYGWNTKAFLVCLLLTPLLLDAIAWLAVLLSS